jgi:uncharacterized membrane protein YraQ (UPF0718 family)/copper chaperone CopZ
MTPFLDNCWDILLELAPWLMIGLLVAGALHTLLPPRFIYRHLGGGDMTAVIKAVILGVPMPLCSCSVIPAAIGIKKEGASDGASMGFLISTPQTGVDSIAVSVAFLGWPFALFKLAAAAVTGTLGGWLANLLPHERADVGETPADSSEGGGGGRQGRLLRTIVYADDLLYMIWYWVVIGIVVSALISTFLGDAALADAQWAHGWQAMLLMLVISVPLYVCATSSVPIAAALISAGFPPGAALVFLMAGPATNVATIGAVLRAYGKRLLAVYLAVVILGSIAAGLLFESMIGVGSGAAAAHDHGASPLTTAVTIVFVLIMSRYLIRDVRRLLAARSTQAPTIVLTVAGMTCNGCVNKLTRALQAVDGVDSVVVDLDSGEARIFGGELDAPTLADTVAASGFSVVDQLFLTNIEKGP